MRRFVIDSNTLASGSVDPSSASPPALLFHELMEMRLEAVVCPELLSEIEETLQKPYFAHRVSREVASEIIAGIRTAAIVREDPTAIEPVLRDPEDDYLIALARQGGAEAIITGDKDLLEHQDIDPPAISPRDACELLGVIRRDAE